MTKPAIALDNTKTVRRPAFRTGRMEMWEATSADGKWHFERIEDIGTPWEITHVDFPGWSALSPSLPKARKNAEVQLHIDLTINLRNRVAPKAQAAGQARFWGLS